MHVTLNLMANTTYGIKQLSVRQIKIDRADIFVVLFVYKLMLYFCGHCDLKQTTGVREWLCLKRTKRMRPEYNWPHINNKCNVHVFQMWIFQIVHISHVDSPPFLLFPLIFKSCCRYWMFLCDVQFSFSSLFFQIYIFCCCLSFLPNDVCQPENYAYYMSFTGFQRRTKISINDGVLYIALCSGETSGQCWTVSGPFVKKKTTKYCMYEWILNKYSISFILIVM